MLEHVPQWLGKAMRGVRAGGEKIAILDPALGADFAAMTLTSMAFTDHGRIPARFTADGEGVSPPLSWRDVPEAARSLALIVEDADSPSIEPLVHAILWNIPAEERALAEGVIVDGGGIESGRTSFFRDGWWPPDPPTGHGAHHYAFQLFALSDAPDLGVDPGRGAVVKAMKGRVLAAGLLIGTYSRGEEAPAGRFGAEAVGAR